MHITLFKSSSNMSNEFDYSMELQKNICVVNLSTDNANDFY